jgi:hypothetical protein
LGADPPSFGPIGPVDAQGVQIGNFQNALRCDKCCPDKKKQEAADLLKDLVQLANFPWNGATGFFGYCDQWVREYWNRYRNSGLPDRIKNNGCLSVRAVRWDNHGASVGIGIGAGVATGIIIAAIPWLLPAVVAGGSGSAGSAIGGGAAVGIVGGVATEIDGPPAHYAIEVTLCTGQKFHMDDGNFGGGAHIFYQIPPWYGRPNGIDPGDIRIRRVK